LQFPRELVPSTQVLATDWLVFALSWEVELVPLLPHPITVETTNITKIYVVFFMGLQLLFCLVNLFRDYPKNNQKGKKVTIR
jgi:hypothetical protein